MDAWFGLGVLLLGAAVGALLTAIAYSSQVRRLRSEIGKFHDADRSAA
jgi:uncharacterized integral membrane protein